ncbi:MAG: hypothetical protein Kow0090_01560 [Myxococcota bacterium]
MKRALAIALAFTALTPQVFGAAGAWAKSDDSATAKLEKAIKELDAETENFKTRALRRKAELKDELRLVQAEISALERTKETLEKRDIKKGWADNAVNSPQEELEIIATLFADWRDELADRQKISGIKAAEDHSKETAGSKPDPLTLFSELEATIANEQNRAGATIIEKGKVFTRGGKQTDASLLTLGRLVRYYITADSTEAGFALSEPDKGAEFIAAPYSPSTSERKLIESLFKDKKPVALFPVDITGGMVIAREEINRSFAETVRAGGVVMIPLLLLALVALLIVVWRFFALISKRNALRFFNRDITAGKLKTDELKSKSPPFVAPILRAFETLDASERDEKVKEQSLLTLFECESFLPTLSALAAVAPLLGLLGTVMGMITTFDIISVYGGGDARLLSGGIAEALITTETGLIIAIPLLLLHTYLKSLVNDIMLEIEELIGKIGGGK